MKKNIDIMKSMKKLEVKIEGWLKPFPHLPVKFTSWVAKNVWWIALVGVILSALATVAVAMTLVMSTFVLNFAGSNYSTITARTYSPIEIFILVVFMVSTIITTVIMAKAVKPLKVQKRRGWDLMFLAFAVGAIISVINVAPRLFTFGLLTGLINAAISAFISAYLLFEIRSYFK